MDTTGVVFSASVPQLTFQKHLMRWAYWKKPLISRKN